MDKNKLLSFSARAAAKRNKGKPFPNSTSLYALGSSSNSLSSNTSSTSQTVSTSSSSSLSSKIQPAKRETPPTPMIKKPKYEISSWEEKAIEKDPNELIKCVNEALSSNKTQTVQSYLYGTVKQLRRTKDPALYQVLGQLVKQKPEIFQNESVTEAFCSFLKKDTTGKMKANLSAVLLAANLMYVAYCEESNWPKIFFKIFIEDSFGDRLWVDNENCKSFVDNIIFSFNTKMPPKHLLNQDILPLTANNPTASIASRQDGFKDGSASSSPSQQTFNEDSSEQAGSPFNLFLNEIKDCLDAQQTIINRFVYMQASVTDYVDKIMIEQLNRKQVSPEMLRNLVKSSISTIGSSSKIRQQVANKMEIWLQNPKLSRLPQDLLLSLCINCNENDNEVIATLVKMRLKTKALINQFVIGIRELVNQNDKTLQVVLRAAIQNEISSNRNRNNMQLIAALFQTKFDEATKTLANLIKEMLIKDDCLKSVRGFVRDIMRSLRFENQILTLFVSALCDDNCEKYDEVDPHDFVVKERLFISIADLISLCIFLCVSPATKELNSCNKERKLSKQLQFQVSEIHRIAVNWLQFKVRKFFNPDRNEFVHCLNKVLSMESLEQYYKLDNWPPEGDRNNIFKNTQDVPLLEETLISLLTMGLSKQHYLQPTEAIEIVDALIRRAAFVNDGDTPYSLKISDENILKMLLKCTTYKAPDNIKLPPTYEPPLMAINDWYWKVWLQILLITSHNPLTIGTLAKNYPTLSILIEMVITNCFEYPPPSRQCEDLLINEQQVQSIERQQIIQFENHLAASTNVVIFESNSLLLNKLITFDPTGIARRPPQIIIDQLKQLNHAVKLGHLLCQSRKPDFLLEIIQRQQKQTALAQNNNQVASPMSWLNDLVEMNSDSFAILPTQCLCEFVLGQSNEEDLNALNCLSNNFMNVNATEKVKRKEKRKKFFKLILHFQNVLNANESSAEELIEYFMKRLSFPQSSYRQVVTKALSLILTSKPSIDEQILISNIEQPCDSRVWLIEKLPKIASFERIKSIACNSLKDAILVESNPENVWNYTNFLSLYTFKPDQSLILNLSRLLIERPIMTKFLIQCEYYSDKFLASCLRLFYKFLVDLIEQENKEINLNNIDTKDYVVIKWTERNRICLLNLRIVHAMILLLTYGRGEEEAWLYDEFLKFWFGPPPQVFSADLQVQITNFIPDWLKLRLIRSTIPTLVDFAMKDLKVTQLLLFIQTFGIPIESMEKLFSALDEICKNDPESVRSSINNFTLMKQLVEVEFMRGVKKGRCFIECINDKFCK